MNHWWRQEGNTLILDHGQVVYEIAGIPVTERGRKVRGWYVVVRYTHPSADTGLFETEHKEVVNGDLAGVQEWCESDAVSVL